MAGQYHHGSLREALLDEARQMLLERGPDAVTLRELARRTGVSHAAPQRHFPDRDALFDALAAAGFTELADVLEVAGGVADDEAALRIYAEAHLGFASARGPLLDLMFSRLPAPEGGATAQAAQRFFSLGAKMLGVQPGPDLGPLPYLLAGTLEGISSLVASGRLAADAVDEVTEAAVRLLLPAIREQRRRTTGHAVDEVRG